MFKTKSTELEELGARDWYHKLTKQNIQKVYIHLLIDYFY